jgi:hypothetical protein
MQHDQILREVIPDLSTLYPTQYFTSRINTCNEQFLFVQYNENDEVKEDEMSNECSTEGENRNILYGYWC